MNLDFIKRRTNIAQPQGESMSSRKPKFKVGDTVRFVQDLFAKSQNTIGLNTLFIVKETAYMAEPLYKLLPLEVSPTEWPSDDDWFAEDEVALVLAVEDLIKVAESNRM